MRSAGLRSVVVTPTCSQMHYARQGRGTEEMAFVLRRENLPDQLVMEEVPAGPQ